MNYNSFYDRFGGSYRTKHLKGYGSKRFENKREFVLPKKSEAPKDFIRLEPWEGEYLYLVARRAQKAIIEIGRFHGGSSLLFSCANIDTPIHSVDLAPQNDAKLTELLKHCSLGENLNLICGDSQETKYPDVPQCDLLFIDGDHSYDGCMKDLLNWYSHVVPGGHVLLHDCYGGSPVQDAVIDFATEHDVQWIRSPYINSMHWHTPEGSLCHFVKPA